MPLDLREICAPAVAYPKGPCELQTAPADRRPMAPRCASPTRLSCCDSGFTQKFADTYTDTFGRGGSIRSTVVPAPMDDAAGPSTNFLRNQQSTRPKCGEL
jgi:hypothetical protein